MNLLTGKNNSPIIERDGKRSSSANTFSSSALHAAAALISAVPETIAMKKCVQKNVPMTPLSVVVAKQLDDEINNSSHRHSLPMTLLAPDMLPKRIPSLRKTSSALQFQVILLLLLFIIYLTNHIQYTYSRISLNLQNVNKKNI